MDCRIAMSDFLKELDETIDERSMLSHPFFALLRSGKLSKQSLRAFTLEYNVQVHMFPTFVSATHANCTDLEVRRMLVENLAEEEMGPDNHPELWKRFGDSLGIGREEYAAYKPLRHTHASVHILGDLARRKEPQEGLASLYAYESQIPAFSRVFLDSLDAHYGLSQEGAGTEFYRVHELADIEHSEEVRNALAIMCPTARTQEDALFAAKEACDAFNLLFDGVYETYC